MSYKAFQMKMAMTTAMMMTMISVMKPNYVFEELVNGLSTYPKSGATPYLNEVGCGQPKSCLVK